MRDIDFLNVHGFNFYGVVRHFADALLAGGNDSLADWVKADIDDFVKAALFLAHHVANEIINIGYGHGYSLRAFAKKICIITGYDHDLIRYDPDRYVGARSKVLDIEKLGTLLPAWNPTPLDQGLQQTVAWFDKEILGSAS